MSERKASMGDKVYRGDVVKFIRDNISLGTFMKRTVKTANEACWDLCDKLNYVPAIEDKNEPHWIPVTEEPKESGKYLVTAVISFIPDHVDDPNTYEAVTTANYSADTRDPIKWWGNNVEKVLAWMPMPEAFKGVTE